MHEPLFKGHRRVYVIDTNALIQLDFTFKRESPVFKAIWKEIEALIEKREFITIDFVENEINDYKGKEDFLKKWIKKWKKILVIKTDAESINASSPIINQEYNSGFLNKRKQAEGKEEADPYLIGFCKVHGYILISNESKTKQNKLPSIASKHNVKCIDLNDFFIERGLQFERTNK